MKGLFLPVLYIMSLGMVFYVYWRAIRPLKCRIRIKAVLLFLLSLIGLKFLLIGALLGGMASPAVSRPVLLVWSWAHGAFCFFTVFLFFRDILLLLRRLWRRLSGRRSAPAAPGHENPFAEAGNWMLSVWLVPALIISCVLSGWGIAQALRVPGIRTVNLFVPALPHDLDGFRIVHLTDLHIGVLSEKKWVTALVREVNGLQPHLIVITGDVADGTPQEREAATAPLRDLHARYGVWGCPGNHEYYSDFSGWRERFPELGIRMLYNEHTVLQIGHRQIVLAGLTDSAGRRAGIPGPDLAAALNGAPPDLPVILLMHRPAGVEEAARSGVDVQLSGHTHGAQLSFLRGLVRFANNGFLDGLYHIGKMNLFISRGTGTWMIFPFRMGVPSEIIEIVLHADE